MLNLCRYDNWVAAMVDWRELEHSQEWHNWVQKAFEAFDVDGSGSIGIKDLQDMLCQGGICAVGTFCLLLHGIGKDLYGCSACCAAIGNDMVTHCCWQTAGFARC